MNLSIIHSQLPVFKISLYNGGYALGNTIHLIGSYSICIVWGEDEVEFYKSFTGEWNTGIEYALSVNSIYKFNLDTDLD